MTPVVPDGIITGGSVRKVKQKNRAYSIVTADNVVIKSFYADCDADAYVDAYLHAERTNLAIDTFACRLVSHRLTIVLDNPFDDAEQFALRLAAKFCSALPALASFRAMRTLVTTMRVSERTGIRCALAMRLFREGYRTRKHENSKRRLEHVTGGFYLESDLTKRCSTSWIGW